MGIIQYFGGMIEIMLTSANVPAALEAITGQGITVYDTAFQSDLTVTFRIDRRDHKRLAALSEKRGDTLKILRRTGIYWTAKGLLKRPVLLAGVTFLLFLAMFLPSRVYFVQVEGNDSVPTRLILAAAQECGIGFGASRREVRSERMKNALLEAVPELRWAGVNTYGCVAVISVRERTDQQETSEDQTPGSIVASRDGVIVSATATDGNLICRVGQAVRTGEVLVSGYTDCGICIQVTRAEGEIYAQTTRDLTAVTPSEYSVPVDQTGVKRKFSMILGKNRINLWKDSGICEGSCGRMYEEYYITLPGGFQLPVCVAVEEYRCYVLKTAETVLPDSQTLLTEFSDGYLRKQMVAGSILSKQQTIIADNGVYRLNGNYVCLEMIGAFRREEIGEYNGKDS